jgi:hypothetical protein
MTRIVPLSVLLSALLLCAASGRSAAPFLPDPDRSLTVRIYDYAQPGDAIRARATQVAARVLASAGVATTWLDCPLTMEQMQSNHACDSETGPSDLVMRLLSPEMHPAVSSQTQTFGYALVDANSTPRIASILFENVERLAFERDLDSSYGAIHRSLPYQRYVAVLLGHVLAHEIGHLLLGTNQHSREGLMQARWDAATTEHAITRRLEFSPRQAKTLRKQLLSRINRSRN